MAKIKESISLDKEVSANTDLLAQDDGRNFSSYVNEVLKKNNKQNAAKLEEIKKAKAAKKK
jgi:hypothetical protein